MALISNFFGWFRRGGALDEVPGIQNTMPSSSLVEGTALVSPDGALQISTVWACIELRANTIASMPYFAYDVTLDGQKNMARNSRLYSLLHESPNVRMTPFEFWRSMMMNHDLRGNAYARIDRDAVTGEALSLWPMPADQVMQNVLLDGTTVYSYTLGGEIFFLASENVLHLKGLGNGTVGLSKLDYMRATTDSAAKAQSTASRLFGTNGKPTGVLMVDEVLKPAQREAIRANFGEIATANTGRLFVLEANMKYQQLSLSPEDQQLLESRNFEVEEICRWFNVPPVLVHHANVTAWGSGISEIFDGFHKLGIRPAAVNIEQAVRKQVMTPAQRARQSAEFNFDALLRGNIKDRFEVYSKAVQNGLKTRNECRQLENDSPITGGDELTAQTNLAPLSMLGKIQNGGSNATGTQNTQAQ